MEGRVAMATYRDFVSVFRNLEIDRNRPIIAHASLSAFGEVHGGVEAVLGAMLVAFDSLIMPAFTYKTMVVPEMGPSDNAISYGSAKDANLMAEFFSPDLPVDPLMGVVAQGLSNHPQAQRSTHPILSFVGVNADQALDAQTLDEPLAPVRILNENEGWVLLMGVDHTVNTSIHYAENVAGRKQYVRWALTPNGAVECPEFPGCSHGFQAVAPRLAGVTRSAQVESAQIEAIPLSELLDIVRDWIIEDSLALLCEREDCEHCNIVREEAGEKVN
jgi:aminoglycoside 3-N-acetyltransferase